MARSLPLLWHIYSQVGRYGSPLIRRMDAKRQLARGMAEERLPERNGVAGQARPPGQVIWLHGVSVGETRVALALAREMLRMNESLTVLLTTTTATAAQIAEQNLPSRGIHQFAPLDTPGAVRRFYDHWEPALGVFTESELWPRLIVRADRRGVPLALVNARLSERSLRRWRKLPAMAAALFSRFSFVAAQTEATAEALEALEAPKALVTGDLKSAAPPLAVDAADAGALRKALAGRPVWVAASTHAGEEEHILAAHNKLLEKLPNALLILAPRHPERGAEVAALAQAPQRSQGAGPEGTPVYIADTIGEMGLWYSLGVPVFLGGSLLPIGGHNPFEPAAFSCPILSGPHVTAFAQSYPMLVDKGAAKMVTPETLEAEVSRLLQIPETARAMGAAAEATVTDAGENLALVARRLMLLLE